MSKEIERIVIECREPNHNNVGVGIDKAVYQTEEGRGLFPIVEKSEKGVRIGISEIHTVHIPYGELIVEKPDGTYLTGRDVPKVEIRA